MKSRRTRAFREGLASLPQQVRDQATSAFRKFQDDPYHPGLHFKKVHPTLPIYPPGSMTTIASSAKCERMRSFGFGLESTKFTNGF
jgi:hypothetical protein